MKFGAIVKITMKKPVVLIFFFCSKASSRKARLSFVCFMSELGVYVAIS